MTQVFQKTTKLQDVPADMVDKVEEYHEMLVESAVEQDDDLMEAYMEGEEPSLEQIKALVSVKVLVILRSSQHTVVLRSKTKVCSLY